MNCVPGPLGLVKADIEVDWKLFVVRIRAVQVIINPEILDNPLLQSLVYTFPLANCHGQVAQGLAQGDAFTPADTL
jgi:hypothetical protein